MRLSLTALFVVFVCAYASASTGDSARTDLDGCRALLRAPVEAVDAAGVSAGRAVLGRGPCDANWEALGPFGGDVQDVAMSPTSSSIVLAGIAPNGSSGGTLYRSTDGGANWSEVAALGGTSVYDIEFTLTGVIYLGTQDSVWKSTDDGASWSQLNLNIGVNDAAMDVAIDPADENVIYAGVDSGLGGQDKNVMRSNNAGATWTDITPVMSAMSCNGVAINPNDSNNLVAAFSGSFGGGAVWVSDDGGATWTNRSAGLPGNPMNDAVHDGARIYVCGGMAFGSQSVGLYASSNNGQTWDQLSDGTWPTLFANDVEVDPADSDNVFVAIRGGVCRSKDAGVSWDVEVGGTGPLMLNSVRLDPGDSSNIFIGASSVAVWRSTDGGEAFAQSAAGIGRLDVYSVASNSNNVNQLAIAFQGLNDGGVYSSDDGGVSWTLEADLPPTRYNTVDFSPDGTLYAISDGPTTVGKEGLYRRNGDGTWTSLGPDQGAYFESELYAMRFSVNDANLIMLGGKDFGVAGHEPTIWRSADAGASWAKVYEGAVDHDNVRDIEIVEDGTDQVMVACFTNASGNAGGALRSTDGGLTWADSSTGLSAIRQGYALSASPTDPDTLYFADGDADGGVYVSSDAGQNWLGAGYSGQRVRDIVSHAADDQVLFIMQWADPKVLMSDDAGATFAAFNDGLGSPGTVRDLAYGVGPVNRLLLATTTGSYGTDVCKCPQPGCASDINGDCAVELGDLATLLPNFGLPGGHAQGDIAPPYDGFVDHDDLALLLSEFGEDCN